jgi:DNA-binding MarR family transcriptional regulator
MEKAFIGKLIGVLYRKSLSYMQHAFKNMGISSMEAIFLIALYDQDGLNQEALSAALVIDKAATARAIKSLEDKGFVERRQDPQDGRAKRVFLTDQGESYREEIYSIMRRWMDTLAQNMDEDQINSTLMFMGSMMERAIAIDCKELAEEKKRCNDELFRCQDRSSRTLPAKGL